MSDNRASIAEEIFAEAFEMPAGPRTAFINERCKHDPLLKHEVRKFIHDAENIDGAFLDPNEIRQLTAAGTGLENSSDEPILQPGTDLGAYTIRGVLGIGGMGVVYRAEQDRPHRTVALKVIRRGLGTRGILKRFEHEAEVLGRLLHPGIAQIYEAGNATVDGREQPYIAMELVEGRNLTQYVAKHKPDTNARLAIFASLCDAVHHAHQRGIIHRDLKPGNVLVTEQGEPKVLDFGVARAVHSDLIVTTLRTNIGQIIGTLAYMSPEQVVGDPADIDIRSDVYSLGVILYELLTGRLPLDLGSRSMPEAARMIREEPPTKLSHVSRVFRGDLDTIVSKAIEKELPRRYQSAADLAADVRRYLAGEPILARRDSLLYVLGKNIQRHKALTCVAASLSLLVVVFAIVATFQAATSHRLYLETQTKLMVSNIQRARGMIATGSVLEAENVLWNERFSHPDSLAPRLALWELYAKFPSSRAIPAYSSPAVAFASSATPGKDTSNTSGFVAIGFRNGTIEIWTLDLNHRACSLQSGTSALTALAFSPDGKRLGSVSMDGRVRVWSVQDWSLTAEIPPQPGCASLFSLAFSPDSNRVASVGEDGTAREYTLTSDSDAPTIVHAMPTTDARMFAIEYSHDGSRIVVGGMLRGLYVFDTISGELIRHLEVAGEAIGSVSFSPNDRTLLATATRGQAHFFDTTTWERQRLIQSEDEWIHSGLFVGDGSQVVFAGDRFVEVWDVATGSRINRLATHTPQKMIVQPARSHGTVLVANLGSTVRSLDLQPAACWNNVLTLNIRIATSLAFDTKSNRFIVADAGGGVGVPESPTGKPRVTTEIGIPGVKVIVLDAEHRRLFVPSRDGILRILDPDSLELVQQFPIGTGALSDLAFCRSRNEIAISAAPGQVQRLSASDGQLIANIATNGGTPRCAAYSPDGSLLAICGSSPSLVIHELSSGATKFRFEGTGYASSVAFSPNGKQVAAALSNSTIVILDATHFAVLHTLIGHAGEINTLAYSPDGKLLASGGTDDGTVRIWDVTTGCECISLLSPTKHVYRILWTPDGTRLLVAGDRGHVDELDLDHYNSAVEGNAPYVHQ
ncbi:MAG: serine/threonine-protein kinase [Phycisphaerales bacterium]